MYIEISMRIQSLFDTFPNPPNVTSILFEIIPLTLFIYSLIPKSSKVPCSWIYNGIYIVSLYFFISIVHQFKKGISAKDFGTKVGLYNSLQWSRFSSGSALRIIPGWTQRTKGIKLGSVTCDLLYYMTSKWLLWPDCLIF